MVTLREGCFGSMPWRKASRTWLPMSRADGAGLAAAGGALDAAGRRWAEADAEPQGACAGALEEVWAQARVAAMHRTSPAKPRCVRCVRCVCGREMGVDVRREVSGEVNVMPAVAFLSAR